MKLFITISLLEWGDRSLDRLLATQAWRPEFGSRETKTKKMLMQHHGPLALALGKQKQNHPGFLLGNQSRQNREIKVQRETLSQNIKPRSDSERQHFHLITLSDFYMRLIE